MGIYQSIFRIPHKSFLQSKNTIIKNITNISSDSISVKYPSTLLKMMTFYFSSKNWNDIELFGDKDVYIKYDLAFIRHTDSDSIKILSTRFQGINWSDIVSYFEVNYDWASNELKLIKYITEHDLLHSKRTTYHNYEYYKEYFEEFKDFYIKADKNKEVIVSCAIP